ncbi:Outer membrane protein assembly factor BamB, contains PQQ-like beta-propeller repeat [Desulfotomaculum arcticum]|uniref:Outer membrane protein assembly factor BamB, contains PQQ-like beta-propeller repeat n=1 Tax=Desulfotruncus arcticus DSM 17038 TaxID=1121424 RepID=A0A1I2T3G7_9FIRM|nr:PQQ-binding-like beta-propeller repeat protein [Desulfotruncus arcticus]SFG56811.1 Outer membrane protein assembly factor BamB, contains PQQ-like beta-propeller repeat [Desulfotomaculum arcticum] [Desulfotruncus arcticus DSM 17038]
MKGKIKRGVIRALMLFLLAVAFAPGAPALAGPGVTPDWERTFRGGYKVDLREDELPAVDRTGNAYVNVTNGWLYCVNPDRTTAWKANLYQSGEYQKTGGAGPVPDEEGNIYLGSGDKKVYALAPDGRVLWTAPMGDVVSPGTSPALGADGTLYVAALNGTLYALDKDTGQQKWAAATKGGWSRNTPVVSPADGTVYVGSPNSVNALNPADVSEKWYRHFTDLVLYEATSSSGDIDEKRMAAGADGTLYIMAYAKGTSLKESRLLALDPADGGIKWQLEVNQLAGAPALDGDTLYYKTEDNRLHAVDTADGGEKWVFRGDEAYMTADQHYGRAPAVGPDGTVYVPLGKNLYAVTPAGEEKWRSTGGQYWIYQVSAPGPGGELYCVASDGRLLKFTDPDLTLIPDRLTLEADFALLKGSTYTLQPGLTDTYGRPMDTGDLQYAGSDPAVLAVDAGGTVRGLAAGAATVTVSHPKAPQVTGTVRITVLEDTRDVTLTVTPANPELLVGNQLLLQAGLTAGSRTVKGEAFEWTSRTLPVVTVDENGMVQGVSAGEGTMRVRVKNRPELAQEVRVLVKEPAITKVTPEEVRAALVKTLGYYAREGVGNRDWVVFGINAAGADVREYGGDVYLARLEAGVRDKGVGSQMTDYERTAIALVSAGADPRDFGGVDLIDKIVNWPDLSQGINASVWGLIALDAANAVVPPGAKNTREALINHILSNRSGKGWAYGGGSVPEPDMTGMALYALAPYRDRPEIRAAGEAAILWLSENQQEDGTYGSWGATNCESSAQVIMALTAWGVDPQGPAFTKKGGNAVTALLNYQTATGMFNHTNSPDPAFATPQGLQALAALQDYLANGVSTIYYKIVSHGSEPVTVTALEIFPDGLEMETGRSIALGVKNQRGIVLDNSLVNWSVSDPDVAGVTDAGLLTTKKAGQVNIVVTLKENSQILDASTLTVVRQDFEIKKIESTDSVDGERNVRIVIKNISEQEKSAVFIVGLYDRESRELIQQSYISKTFLPGGSHQIEATFSVPGEGDYEVRAMVWNDWLKGRALTDLISE